MSIYNSKYYHDFVKASREELYNISSTSREYFEREIKMLNELKPASVEELRIKYAMMAEAYKFLRFYDAFCKLYCYS